MQKISYIFIFIHIFIASAYAELSKEQMKQYWENSRAQYMFDHIKKNLERDLYKIVQTNKENASPALVYAIDTFVNNPKYLKKYKDTFSLIDNSVYKELNEFYSVDLGKKYRKLGKNEDYRIFRYVKKEYEELIKNNPISKEKLKFISNIDTELNLVEIKIDFARKLKVYKERVLYPEDNVTDAQIDEYMVKYKAAIEEYESMLMPILYSEFTMDELKEILKHASSKILAIEVEYIYKAAHEFLKQSLADIKEDYKRLIMIGYCKDYPNKRGYIPDNCKKEWLAQ